MSSPTPNAGPESHPDPSPKPSPDRTRRRSEACLTLTPTAFKALKGLVVFAKKQGDLAMKLPDLAKKLPGAVQARRDE